MQDKIIKIADNLFTKYGIRSVSIDDVCKEIGVSKKTFYLYFAKKEDLVDAVMAYYDKQKKEHVKKLSEGKNAIEVLLAAIKEARKMSSNTDKDAILYDLKKYYPKIGEKYLKEMQKNTAYGFEKNLLQGIKEGYYREDLDVDLLSTYFSFQHKDIIDRLKDDSRRFSNKRIVDFFIEMITCFILTEKGRQFLKENE